MVRLKETLRVERQFQQFCFNSNMVRLKVEIKQTSITKPEFQFQYGTIKSPKLPYFLNIFGCFNSNMVRLKVLFLFIAIIYKKFQFQYGTIKRQIYIYVV